MFWLKTKMVCDNFVHISLLDRIKLYVRYIILNHFVSNNLETLKKLGLPYPNLEDTFFIFYFSTLTLIIENGNPIYRYRYDYRYHDML